MFQQLVGPYINPVVMAKMVTDAIDFDFAEELMVYNALGIGTNPVSNAPVAQKNAASQVAATRIAPQQTNLQPMLEGM